MNLWISKLGETIAPLDGVNVRPHRAISLARELTRRGHNVTYWTSSMDHYGKRERCSSTIEVMDEHGVRLRVLYAKPYSKNVSLSRILHHIRSAREFLRVSALIKAPDVIFSSFPTSEMCLTGRRYKAQGVPILCDVRDLWPDIFTYTLPRAARPFAKALFLPFAAHARRALRLADAISGITDEFVDWGARTAGRSRTSQDRAFHLAYYPESVSRLEELNAARNYWKEKLPFHRFLVVFMGSFSKYLEIMTVVKAARYLSSDSGVVFVLAGVGDQDQALRQAASGLKHVVFPGWIDAPKISTLLSLGHVGLLPYPSREDFMMSYPNKVGEYFSAALPIVTSLDGIVRRFISIHECGLHYPNNDWVGLANCISSLSLDPLRYQLMRGAALGAFKQYFDASRIYSDMASWIEAHASSKVRQSTI